MLIEAVMTIQRIIDEDGIPPKGPDGRRIPLGVAVDPTFSPSPQPVGLTVAP